MAEFFRSIVDRYGELGFGLRIAIIAIVFVATTIGGIVVVVRLPATHFLQKPPPDPRYRRHPILRITALVLKNLLGILVLPIGIIMSLPLVPGPGLVFVLLGLSLLDFPGKRALERALIRRPLVMRLLNQMRARFRRPPFEVELD